MSLYTCSNGAGKGAVESAQQLQQLRYQVASVLHKPGLRLCGVLDSKMQYYGKRSCSSISQPYPLDV
jgi:N-glycosylase/DNA lyase